MAKYSKPITEQGEKNHVDILTSLLEINTHSRLKEQSILKSELNTLDENKKVGLCETQISMNVKILLLISFNLKTNKVEAMKQLKELLKSSIKEMNDMYKLSEKNQNFLTRADLAEIEAELQNSDARNLLIKGSRFTHSEKLQFSKETDSQVSILSGDSEEVIIIVG